MRRRTVFTLALIGLFGLAACHSPVGRPPFVSMDINGAQFGQDFRLTDPSGHVRTLADFRGQLVMVFFGYTQCPDVCPTTLARAAQIRKRLGADAQRLQVIFITVDPERDTPALLQAYTRAFDSSFLALYTNPEGTRQLADAFHIYFRKVPSEGGYSMDHSTLSYVYDTHSRLRLAVRYEQSVDEVVADLRRLLDDHA